jgi:hypothetical protein
VGEVYAGYEPIRSPMYHGIVSVRTEWGEPVVLWRCEHEHAQVLQASSCAAMHLEAVLAAHNPH